MKLSPGKYTGIRRLAGGDGRFCMTAVDQRPPIFNRICEKRGTKQPPDEDVRAVKRMLVEVLAPHSTALLLDPIHALPAAMDAVSPRQGLIHTLERHDFEDTADGRLSHAIANWSVEKIKRAGGDGVKVLAWYRPDGPSVGTSHQQRFVKAIGTACRKFDLPFVLELLLYPLDSDRDQTKDYVEQPNKRPELVVESVATFADPAYGVDLFKLESPLPATNLPDPGSDQGEVQTWFNKLDRAAGRPWVVLSAGATKDAFRRVVTYAYRAGASGYLAGRAIWWDAFQAFPDMAAMRDGLVHGSVDYMRELNAMTADQARPWFDHPGYGGAGIGIQGSEGSIAASYRGFDA
ncbi:MAG: tagatose 1,6-diphosphate aldolase [Geminicoccaceae bacterium]